MSRKTFLGGQFRRLIGQYAYSSLTCLTFTLGQIAKYMFDEKRKYGFLTTYEQTMFLKQEQVGKEWVLLVSHVFKHTVTGRPPMLRMQGNTGGCLRQRLQASEEFSFPHPSFNSLVLAFYNSSPPSTHPHVSYTSHPHNKHVNNSTGAYFEASHNSDDGIEMRLTGLETEVKDFKADVKDVERSNR
jgi:hypothetical protein